MENDKLLVPDKIIKSNRKSISIQVTFDGELIVRAPYFCSEKAVDDFINRKANWIIKKRIEALSSQYKPVEIQDEKHIVILCCDYEIKLTNNKKCEIVGNNLFVPSQNSKQILINFLKAIANSKLENRVRQIATSFGFSYSKISISTSKSCWGSCNQKNELRFTYKLMLCPAEIVDYIILHELCHTKVKSHSKSFWKLVQQTYPNYKHAENWLRNNRSVINVI